MKRNAAVAFYLLHQTEARLTTSDVAGVVFSPEDSEEHRNAERKVRYYFTDGYEHLVEEDERDDGTTVYTTDGGCVWAGPGVMHVGDEEELVRIDFGEVLVYENGDGTPEAVQLEGDGVLPSVTPPEPSETEF